MYGGIYYGPKARPAMSRSTPWAPTPAYQGDAIALQTSMTPFNAGDFDPVGMEANLPNPHYLHDWSGPNVDEPKGAKLSEWFSNITTNLAANFGNIKPGLADGAQGSDVEALQQGLISIGFGPQLGPRQADGIYGDATAGAVQNFQRSKGLTPTGAVDAETANALNRALTMKMGLAQWQQQQGAGTPQAAPGPRIGLAGAGGAGMEWGQLALAALFLGAGLWGINKLI